MEQKISVIIPAYNIAPYLPRTLDSVLGQTQANLEIIVVDDGSADETGRVLDAYAARDSRIIAIHQENGGVTAARQRGVAAATGDWIGFVDGDDFIEPEMFSRLLHNALRHRADISHCGYQMVFPDGHVDFYYNTGRLLVQDRAEACDALLSGAYIEPGLWNKLYRRELFRHIPDKMDRQIRINEDLLMNYFLFKAGTRTVYEDICPYHYMLRRGSAATAALNAHQLWDPLRVLHLILADPDGPGKPAALQRLTRLLIGGATMDSQLQPELVAPYRLAARRELRQRLGQILRLPACSLPLKCMAVWAAVWPSSYRLVHRAYARVTGSDRKYSLD